MPPKSTRAKRSDGSKESSPTTDNTITTTSTKSPSTRKSNTTKMTDQSDNGSDGDEDDESIKLNIEQIGVLQWIKNRPPEAMANHLIAWNKVKGPQWAEFCSVIPSGPIPAKPNEAQCKKIIESLLVIDHLATKKFGSNVVIYWNDRTGIVNLVSELSIKCAQAKASTQYMKQYREQLAQITVGREETPHRADLQKEQIELEQKIAQVNAEIEMNRHADPELIAEWETRIEQATEATNYWTAGMFSIHRFYTDRQWTDASAQEYFKQNGLPDDFDDLPTFKRRTPRPEEKKRLVKK